MKKLSVLFRKAIAFFTKKLDKGSKKRIEKLAKALIDELDYVKSDAVAVQRINIWYDYTNEKQRNIEVNKGDFQIVFETGKENKRYTGI